MTSLMELGLTTLVAFLCFAGGWCAGYLFGSLRGWEQGKEYTMVMFGLKERRQG